MFLGTFRPPSNIICLIKRYTAACTQLLWNVWIQIALRVQQVVEEINFCKPLMLHPNTVSLKDCSDCTESSPYACSLSQTHFRCACHLARNGKQRQECSPACNNVLPFRPGFSCLVTSHFSISSVVRASVSKYSSMTKKRKYLLQCTML